MIRLLVALHPKTWRTRYGAEYRALLEDTPLTARVVLDVLRTAARLHLAGRRVLIAVLAALTLSTAAEVIAVQGNFTANILWLPSSPMKAIALATVLLPWVPVVLAVRSGRATRQENRRHHRIQDEKNRAKARRSTGPGDV